MTSVAVGTEVTSRPPRRSRRAAFPHRAPVAGQTRPRFGAWAALAPPVRRLAAPVTCLIRLRSGPCVAACLPHNRPPSLHTLRRRRGRPCSGLHRYYTAVWAAVGERRSPRFRRDPFVRELGSDPRQGDGASHSGPAHVAFGALDRLGPALKFLSWLHTDPARSLCPLRRGRHLPRRNTRYRWALPQGSRMRFRTLPLVE